MHEEVKFLLFLVRYILYEITHLNKVQIACEYKYKNKLIVMTKYQYQYTLQVSVNIIISKYYE